MQESPETGSNPYPVGQRVRGATGPRLALEHVQMEARLQFPECRNIRIRALIRHAPRRASLDRRPGAFRQRIRFSCCGQREKPVDLSALSRLSFNPSLT